MHIHLYLISGLEILLPVIALIVLSRFHKFRFNAVIAGIAAFFLTSNILMPLFTMMLTAVGANDLYWSTHVTFSNVLNVILNSVFHDVTLFFLLKYTLIKKKAKVYDAMALGISYWISDSVQYAISNVTYARVAQLSAQGNLSAMVRETVTLDQLQSAADDVLNLGVAPFYYQILALAGMLAISVAVCLFLYLSIKRSNILQTLLFMLVHLVVLIIVSLPQILQKEDLTLTFDLLSLVIGCVFIWRFMKWYREKQRALLYRKNQYKEALKTSSQSTEPTE